MNFPSELQLTIDRTRAHLLSMRNEQGHWEGRLSSSALSTATAVVALGLYDRERGEGEHDSLLVAGFNWLIENQNHDGGWGDTVLSFSNVSTTMLCYGALHFAKEGHVGVEEAIAKARSWLKDYAGADDAETLIHAIIERYGDDRTFSVPILTMCTLTGCFGKPEDVWPHVIQLPFELAAFPQKWFPLLNLRVVSYALPALIAIGLARHRNAPSWNPVARLFRNLVTKRVLKLLRKIQPTTGGYLEATPLTSFVTMSLISAGEIDHPTVNHAVEFLRKSIREDGSWPIDTNLATWTTTLSINALAGNDNLEAALPADERERLQKWLLGQQYKTVHPYTNANPGGWAWTDLAGGVPDADDTSSAIISLKHFYDLSGDAGEKQRLIAAARAGIKWLLSLQNRDGGIPTFCRGWGKLPFDQSCPDITAHTIQAVFVWENIIPIEQSRVDRMVGYLQDVQQEDNTFLPLWFGNQHVDGDINPIYGTAKVIEALAATQTNEFYLINAVSALLQFQTTHGTFSCDQNHVNSSIEETAVALRALAVWYRYANTELNGSNSQLLKDVQQSIELGAAHLIELTEEGQSFEPSPIGFYFANLWYFEALYPVIWTLHALNAVKLLPAVSPVTD